MIFFFKYLMYLSEGDEPEDLLRRGGDLLALLRGEVGGGVSGLPLAGVVQAGGAWGGGIL